MNYPSFIPHWIGNKETASPQKNTIEKINPATGKLLAAILRGNAQDVNIAVSAAVSSFSGWSGMPVTVRADLLREATLLMRKKKEEIATIVHLETGKSMKDARAEVAGAIELGFFMAGEGRRFYGKTTTSAVANRRAMTIRQPVGVAALIVPFNTPIANVAWKAFPALLCGNTVVMKAAKDTPYTPVWFAKILAEAGIPAGVFNVIQGTGEEAGEALISDPGIDLISFTGSTETGKHIQSVAAARLAKVSLEMGGKNALVVCDDADMEAAVEMTLLSAFSNAGQRCASASRIIVFESVYGQFKKMLVKKTEALILGSKDTDDVGPVINERQLTHMIDTVKAAQNSGVKVLSGGSRAGTAGFFITPTVLEHTTGADKLSGCELFGPVTSLYAVKNFREAVGLVNDSPYGLTAAIHTKNMHRVEAFIQSARVGVVSINGPTYGSEPHMPFGGVKQSGTGWREPGTEALDFYSELKTVYIRHNPASV